MPLSMNPAEAGADRALLDDGSGAAARRRAAGSRGRWRLSTVKLPEICPEPPRIGSRITGAEITSLSSTIANGRPTFSCVTCAKRRAPLVLKRKVTIGSLVRWSKPGCASVRSSPDTMSLLLDQIGRLPFLLGAEQQFGFGRRRGPAWPASASCDWSTSRKVSFAVLPRISLSARGSSQPGTCTRMRSTPLPLDQTARPCRAR